MEKASSGTPRLTRRSAAQQVKTPLKAVNSEENGNCEADKKKGSSRKGRPRKSDTKPKTNGESVSKLDGVNTETSSLDECESESEKLKSTTRRPTRVSRSINPGLECEVNVTKRLRRSTSESKLDSVSTPTKRRLGRAQSESKDVVFSPMKNADMCDELQVARDLRTCTLAAPAVESIAEGEEESSQDDPVPLAEYVKKLKTKTFEEDNKDNQEKEEKVHIDSKDSNATESDSKTDCGGKSSNKTEIVNNDKSRNDPKVLVVEKTEQSIGDGLKTENDVSTVTLESNEEAAGQLEPVVTEESEKLSLIVEETQQNCNQLYETVTELKVLDSDSLSLKEDVEKDNSKPCGKPICDKIEIEESLKNKSLSPKAGKDKQENAEEVNQEKNDTQEDHSTNDKVENVPSEHSGFDLKLQPYSEEESQEDHSTNDKVENVPSEHSGFDLKLQPCSEETETQYTTEGKNHEKELDTSNKNESGNDSFTLEIENVDEDQSNLGPPKRACEDPQYSPNKDGLSVSDNINIGNNQKIAKDISNTSTSADVDLDGHIEDGQAVLIEDSMDSANEEVENIKLSYDEGNDCINPENKQPGEFLPVDKTTLQSTSESSSLQIENSTALDENSGVVTLAKDNEEKSGVIEICDDRSEEGPQIKITEIYQVDEVVTDPLENDYATNRMISSEGKESFSREEEQNYEEKESLDDEKHFYSSEEDIYKDMSNFGSDNEDQRDGDKNEPSSSPQSDDSYDSSLVDDEEEVGEDEYEEEEQDSKTKKEQEETKNVDENTKLEKISTQQESSEKKGQANKKELGTEEGSLETPSPMTYDKALEILNKDRDKKIDDEEFYDMFTQELNKVSEPEANSDSDIAIVDEYIPENPPKPKPVIKTIKIQRPIQRPQAPVQQQYPPQQTQFTGHFNQIQSQHPPNVPRVSFPQEVSLNQHHPQYIQDFSHMNTMSNQNFYKHYGPAPSNAPDLRMYNSHIPTTVPPENHGFPGYKIGQTVDTPLHFPSHLGLKLRNVDPLSVPSHAGNQSGPSSQINNQMFYEPHMTTNSEKLQDKKTDLNTNNKVSDGKYKSDRYSSPEHETTKSHTSSSKNDDRKVDTPILKMFGLDKNVKAVKLELKKLESEGNKSRWNKAKKKKVLIKSLIKSLLKEIEKEDLPSPTSCEVSNDCSYSRSSRDYRYIGSSTDSSSSESESSSSVSFKNPKLVGRQIYMEEDNISVTIPRGNRQKGVKSGLVNKQDTNIETVLIRRKRKNMKRKLAVNSKDSSDDSVRENYVLLKKRKLATQQKDSEDEISSNLKSKRNEMSTQTKAKDNSSSSSLFTKMGQKKQKKIGVLQSKCGVFIVEKPASATSQSSESEGASQSSSSDYLEQVKKRIKSEASLGKNRLSNIFTKQSFKANSKKLSDLKGGRVEKRRKRPTRVLSKLPAHILEQLDEEKKQEQVSPDSEIEDEKKKKKKSKVKVKSAALSKEYIPYVTPDPVATQFALNRLDVDEVLSTAHSAAKFRSGQLSSVQRITSKELMNIKKKQKRTNPKKK